MSALSKLRTIWRPARAGGVTGRAGAAWAVVSPARSWPRAPRGAVERPPPLSASGRGGGIGQGDRPLGGRRRGRRRGHGHGSLGARRGRGRAGSGTGAPAEDDGKAEDRDPAARQLLDHSSSVGGSCASVLGGSAEAARPAAAAREHGYPGSAQAPGGLAARRTARSSSLRRLYAGGGGGLARFRGVGEQHLEGLAPPAQHDPIRLDLLEAGIPHEVPYRVREDPPPLHVFQVGSAPSLGQEHDPVEPRLRRGRGRRAGPVAGAGRFRRGLGPRRAEEVALGDDGEGRERSFGARRRRRRAAPRPTPPAAPPARRRRARAPGLVEAHSEEGRDHEQEAVDEQEDAPRHGSASGPRRRRGRPAGVVA